MPTTITFVDESDDIGVIADVLNALRGYGVRITTTAGEKHSGAIDQAGWNRGVTLYDQWGNETIVPVSVIDMVEIT